MEGLRQWEVQGLGQAFFQEQEPLHLKQMQRLKFTYEISKDLFFVSALRAYAVFIQGNAA